MKRIFPLTGLLLAVAVLLSACGFHLRGTSPHDSLPFATIHFAFPDSAPLAVELKRNLRGGGTVIVPNRSAAQVSLELLAEKRTKSILSLNAMGRARQYELVYSLRFQLKDAKGRVLMQPTEIVQKRTLDYNETYALAKEIEEADLYRDMQSDIIAQLIRRLATVKLTPEASVSPANAAPARQP
ncbi:MAG: rare lipoB family protein [Burkholderiaceae bacterium]|nr:rare lipoB family protein [Burkholderiaceae bacterium]